jgi:hypothetical protein
LRKLVVEEEYFDEMHPKMRGQVYSKHKIVDPHSKMRFNG